MARKIREYHPLDLTIRRVLNAGMEDGTLLTIEFTWGFEEWGSYENWAGGYIVSGRGQRFGARHLEDAINGWAQKVEKARANEVKE